MSFRSPSVPVVEQLDLFEHSHDTMLRNDAIDALLGRDACVASTARQKLSGLFPQHPDLNSLATLIGALRADDVSPFADPAAAARAREHLADEIAPAAVALLGSSAAGNWLAPLWRGLAERASALPFNAAHPEDHASPLWLRAGDARLAAEAAARVESWRRIPVTLAWMVRARHRVEGLDGLWPLLAELVWLAAPRFELTTRELADPLLDRLLRRFDERFDPGPGGDTNALVWFPAWLLTEQPALLPRLREARTGQDGEPERCFRLLAELLGLERQGRHRDLIDGRKRLRDQQPALYATYMATR